MKIIAIASAFVAFISGKVVSANTVKAASEALRELMVVTNKDSFVARDYGTFSLPPVKPSLYKEEETQVPVVQTEQVIEKRGDN